MLFVLCFYYYSTYCFAVLEIDTTHTSDLPDEFLPNPIPHETSRSIAVSPLNLSISEDDSFLPPSHERLLCAGVPCEHELLIVDLKRRLNVALKKVRHLEKKLQTLDSEHTPTVTTGCANPVCIPYILFYSQRTQGHSCRLTRLEASRMGIHVLTGTFSSVINV